MQSDYCFSIQSVYILYQFFLAREAGWSSSGRHVKLGRYHSLSKSDSGSFFMRLIICETNTLLLKQAE